jgi:hypothetical protein
MQWYEYLIDQADLPPADMPQRDGTHLVLDYFVSYNRILKLPGFKVPSGAKRPDITSYGQPHTQGPPNSSSTANTARHPPPKAGNEHFDVDSVHHPNFSSDPLHLDTKTQAHVLQDRWVEILS